MEISNQSQEKYFLLLDWGLVTDRVTDGRQKRQEVHNADVVEEPSIEGVFCEFKITVKIYIMATTFVLLGSPIWDAVPKLMCRL